MQILLKRLRYNIDQQRRQVATTWAGHFESVATYHEGCGCVLGEASSLWRNPPKFGCGKGERVGAGSAAFGMVKR